MKRSAARMGRRTFTIDPPMFARKTYEATIWATPLGVNELAKKQFKTRDAAEAWARKNGAKPLLERAGSNHNS